jgi:hypothetical protein
VVASENSSVEARGNSSVEARGNSSVVAWGNSRVVARGNSSVEARDNSSVVASENSIIKIYSKFIIIEAKENSIIIFYDIEKSNFKKDNSVRVIKTKTVHHTNKVLDYFNKSDIKDNKVILYKIVKDDYTDFYSGKIEYKVGDKIVCPDWVDNNNIECGNGLHLSKKLIDAKKYNKPGKILKCEVDINDMNVYSNGYQNKFRCKKVKVIEEIK